MRYAIVAHGGKQYLAEEGQAIEVDRLGLEVGKPIEFGEILLVADGKKVEVGTPFVAGASVRGKVTEHPNGRKLIVFKHHPKQRYRRTKGHRRRLTRIEIDTIGFPGSDESSGEPRKASGRPAKRAATKRSSAKPAARKAAAKPKPKPKTKTGRTKKKPE